MPPLRDYFISNLNPETMVSVIIFGIEFLEYILEQA
jgi:hypothetical protein